MALLPVQAVVAAGLTPTMASAAAGGDKVPLGSANTWIEVANGGGSSVTVTVTVQNNTYKGLTLPNRTVTVAASASAKIPLDASLHGDNNNQASIGYSGVTSVTVGAFRI
ncbi:hypothetical protein OG747_36805 [Streptomyces sp. NBC_01384]|uniref:hypothetical protein n=1 Tax=Streptomyces sp. NBC_01384 TaxID=2903847 RepID=UPI00324E27C6